MAAVYKETPENLNEIVPYINQGNFVEMLYSKRKCYFYDTCSFRYHANMNEDTSRSLWKYIKEQDGIIILTRCILMELASIGGLLNDEYVQYIKKMHLFGLPVFVIYEEELFDVMSLCFSTKVKVNSLLMWAIRMIKSPVSTITLTLQEDAPSNDLLQGRKLDRKELYKHFFRAARSRKEADDNLGEELLAVCLYILSQLPGERDGKFCIITDDKGAAGKIDRLFKRTPVPYQGKKIILFSTPKLAQILYEENYLSSRDCLISFLSAGSGGYVRVLGTQIYDLVSREISLTCEETADLIISNGIHITF